MKSIGLILKPQRKLGQWLSTAISGNDITSSCLYVSAIAAYYVGALAPVVLLVVGIALYFYRKIYTEVVEALPLNGGAYNCLLNSTSKFSAALAACTTILSYLATSVLSAKTAVSYLHSLLPAFDVLHTTVGVLFLFAVLTIIGIGESAVVALVIFVSHLITLIVLCLFGLKDLAGGIEIISSNWALVPADGHRLMLFIFLGFSASLLGISGFESSANFVEEQKTGVFRKTLRNMWLAVLILNPLISFLSLSVLPVGAVVENQDYLLAHMGKVLGGNRLQSLIVIDAFLVLSGAVLTSYIGVTGLVRRMTLDQCLPQFFLKQNRARGTYHRIIIGFFLLASSILYVTGGNLLALAGVYTISFLSVMSLFALGNMLLKVNRRELKRTFRAGWPTVLIGFFATFGGIIGNIVIDYRNFFYFLTYFIPTVLVVSTMYLRLKILKSLVQLDNKLMKRIGHIDNRLIDKLFVGRSMVVDKIMEITRQNVLVFTRGGNLPKLRQAFDYIIKNEDSKKVYVVYLQNEKDDVMAERIKDDLEVMDRAYPEIELEFVCRKGTFGPEAVREFSDELNIPINNMFVGAPESKHNFDIQDLGGVRVIF